jgi:hypothetical protein
MKQSNTRWQQKSPFEKFLTITSITCSITVIVLALLQLLGVWNNAVRIYMPLTALVMLIQAKELWNKSRTAAIVNLCAAIFIAIICILILFIL